MATKQDELTTLLLAIRPFAQRISVSDKNRVKVRLNPKHDTAQLSAVLSGHEALIQHGNDGVFFIDYGERDAKTVAEIVARVSGSESSG